MIPGGGDLPLVRFGGSDLTVSTLGLGCSRIASLSTVPGADEIARLIDSAHEGGIRLFDTADIYGQGDSERRLAGVAARSGTVIVTKAGLRLNASQAAIRLMKPLLRPVLNRLKGAKETAAAMRAENEASELGSGHLRAALEGSLRRLKRDRVEVFLLHSPPVDALADGRLYDLLDRFRDEGKAVLTGVSCRSLDDAGQVVAGGRAQAVELPLTAGDLDRAAPVLDAAAAAGTGVIAREALAGMRQGQGSLDDALGPLLDDVRVHTVLTGTTNPAHLAENLGVARARAATAG